MLSGHTFHQKVLKPVQYTYYLSQLCLYVFCKDSRYMCDCFNVSFPLPLNFHITNFSVL
jgi:hypothetical protein